MKARGREDQHKAMESDEQTVVKVSTERLDKCKHVHLSLVQLPRTGR